MKAYYKKKDISTTQLFDRLEKSIPEYKFYKVTDKRIITIIDGIVIKIQNKSKYVFIEAFLAKTKNKMILLGSIFLAVIIISMFSIGGDAFLMGAIGGAFLAYFITFTIPEFIERKLLRSMEEKVFTNIIDYFDH